MVRRCWVNFQCRGVLLIWITVGQGPTALAVSAGGGCLDIFTLIYHFSFLSPSLWETARYRLKYCLKGPLSPKQPTNQPTEEITSSLDCLKVKPVLLSGGVNSHKPCDCVLSLFLLTLSTGVSQDLNLFLQNPWLPYVCFENVHLDIHLY